MPKAIECAVDIFFTVSAYYFHNRPLYMFILLQQRQYILITLIGLGQHGLSGLGQDIIIRIFYHFRTDIRIPDQGLCRRSILNNVVQIADGML